MPSTPSTNHPTATSQIALLLIERLHSFFFLHGLGDNADSFQIHSLDENYKPLKFEIIVTLAGEIYLDDTKFCDAKSVVDFIDKTISDSYNKTLSPIEQQ